MNRIKNAAYPNKKDWGHFFMSRKAKISFLILVWGIVAVQLYVNWKTGQTADSPFFEYFLSLVP